MIWLCLHSDNCCMSFNTPVKIAQRVIIILKSAYVPQVLNSIFSFMSEKNWSKYKMNQIMKLCHSQKYCHYLFFLALHTRKNLTKLVPLEKKISNFIVPPPPKTWKIQISWTTTFQQFFRFFYCRRVVVQCIPTR